MNRSQPSSLVLALLRFVESENEALAGDLAEEWRAGRSRTWLWRQLARAVFLVAWRKRTSEETVIRLVSATPFDRPDRAFDLIDPATMNLRGFRVRGVGGGGLLGIVMLTTFVLPQAWFVVLTGIVGGVAIGVALIVRRHARGLAGPDDSAPLALFGAHDTNAPVPVQTRRSDVARLATALAL
jgi:hypothetical protein